MDFSGQSHLWTAVDDDRMCMQLEFFAGMAFAHLQLKKKGPRVMRAVREYRRIILGILRDYGFKTVNVVVPETDRKLYRFAQFFGFSEVKRNGGQVLMQKET